MKYEDVHNELLKWKNENIISEEQFCTLEERYKPHTQSESSSTHINIFSQKVLFYVGMVIVILGTLTWLGDIIPIFNDIVVITSLGLFIAGTISFGKYLTKKSLSVLKYVGKFIITIGCILTTFAVFYLDIKIYNKLGIKLLGNDWSLFILIGGIILIGISYKLKNRVILGYSLFSFLLWFISEGKIRAGEYISTWLGLSFPTRFLIISLILLILGYVHEKGKGLLREKYISFSTIYNVFGLVLAFLISLNASMGKWVSDTLLPLNIYKLVFLFVCVAVAIYTVYMGLVNDRGLFLKLGLVFFIGLIYGKLLEAFTNNFSRPLFYLIVIIVGIFIAVAVEYTIKNKERLKTEILKGKS